MIQIYDYLLLFLYGIIGLLFLPFDLSFIIGLLLVIIIFSTFFLLSNKTYSYIILFVFLLVIILDYNVLLFIPLFIYSLLHTKYKLLLMSLSFCIIYYKYNFSFANTSFILFGTLLAILLAHKTKSHLELEAKYKKTRDDGVEKNMLLIEKYNSLRKNQDYEIYTATLQERNRIAREIHDNVGHMLSRALLMIGAIKTTNQNTQLGEQLNALDDTLSDAMNNIRNSVHKLHDDSIDLENAILDILKDSTLEIQLDYDISEFVSKNIKYCIIAIIKEAYNNVLKHSDATKLNIITREHPGLYQLIIHDNGSICPYFLKTNSDLPISGIGLENMTNRIKSLNGNINFSYNNGFKVFITIPKS